MAENFHRSGAQLITINPTVIYQSPILSSINNSKTIVLSCLIANIDGVNPADISVEIQDINSITLSKIAHTITIPPNATLELINNKLILLAGEKLIATASAPNDLDCTVSVLELF